MWFPRLDSDLAAVIHRAQLAMDKAINQAQTQAEWQVAYRHRQYYRALIDEQDRRLLKNTAGQISEAAPKQTGRVVRGHVEGGGIDPGTGITPPTE